MRILIVTHYWKPHRGGVETVAREQACRLFQRGHTVSVVTSRLAGDSPVTQEDGFPVYRARVSNFLESRGIPYPLFSPGLMSLLGRQAQIHDVLLIHSHTFLSSVAGVLMARRRRRPAVLLQHNPFIQYRFPWNSVEHAADFALGRYALRSATTLLAISEHTRQYVQKLTKRAEVNILYNGVDTCHFTPADSLEHRRDIRASLGLPLDAFLLFTVRRLVFRNGLDTLLEACVKLKERPDLHVVIGGSGPQRGAMERFISQQGLKNVHLVGFIADEDLPKFYRAADAFVLPTRTGEGFGLVILEAFASGIPVISTRAGAQEEVVEEGRTGFLVLPESPDAIAEAAISLSDNPELARKMGRRARAKAAAMDWDISVNQLEDALEQTIAARIT